MYIFLSVFINSILISCVTALALVYYFYKAKKEYFREIMNIISSDSNFAGSGMENEMENLIDHRLNEMVAGFKTKIPMIGMFLSQTKENELKASAKDELMQMIPAIKQKFLNSEVLSKISDRLIDKLWKKIFKHIFIISFLVGTLLGILGICLLVLFGVR